MNHQSVTALLLIFLLSIKKKNAYIDRSQFLNFHFPLWPVGYSNLFFLNENHKREKLKIDIQR